MSNIHMKLTEKGRALQAKINAGEGTIPLQITRVVSLGSQSADPLNEEFLADLDVRQTAQITKQDHIGTRAIVEVQLSNQGNPTASEPPLTTGYELFGFGMGAMDPDDGEILYRISQYDTSAWIPPATEMGWTVNPSWNFSVENADSVVVTIDPAGMATIGQLNDHIEETIATSPTGVHGIRYDNGVLQVLVDDVWIDVVGAHGVWSVDANGVITNSTPFSTVVPIGSDDNIIVFNDGFASVSGEIINLI